MSLRAVAEFILHLEHFRNIDLIQQGIYFLKFQIFNEDKDKIYYANPYHFECKDTELNNRGNGDDDKVSFHRLIEPYIVDETNSFYTKTFFIRYAEELVVLRDVVKFRTEIDVKEDYLNTEFYLKAELFYQAPPANNFSQCMSSATAMQEELQRNGEEFRMVQARLYQLNKGLQGQSSFCPILMDREYTCLTMSTVHASLINYSFRMIPVQGCYQKKEDDNKEGFENINLQQMQNILDQEDQTFQQNGIIVESKYEANEEERKGRKLKQFAKKYQTAWIPSNMTEYLFYDDTGCLTINEEQVKSLFIEFTSIMRNVHKNISKKYEDVIKSIIMDTDLNNIDFPLLCEQIKVDGLGTFLTEEL